MKKNLKIQMPTSTIKNLFYSILNTLWAIGCSAAAPMLASSKYDSNQQFIYEKGNVSVWNSAGGHQDVPPGERNNKCGIEPTGLYAQPVALDNG